jgi:hypothetical protein
MASCRTQAVARGTTCISADLVRFYLASNANNSIYVEAFVVVLHAPTLLVVVRSVFPL